MEILKVNAGAGRLPGDGDGVDDGPSGAPRAKAAPAPAEDLDAWLREHPDVFQALSRNEPVTAPRFPRKNASAPALLIPVHDSAGLQRVLCCDAAGAALDPQRFLCALLREIGPALLRGWEQQPAAGGPDGALRRKRLESDLALARREKRKLEMLRQMSLHSWSNALHELRTPLVAVRGYARMLLAEEPGAINDAQRQFLEIILDNASRLARVLNDLAGFSQNHDLRVAPCDMRALWQQVLELLRPQAGRKSIRITERSAPASVVVVADREKLLPVFCRLLSEAIETTRDGGAFQVEFWRNDERAEMRLYGSGAGAGLAGGGEDPHWAPLREIVLLHGGRASLRHAPGEPSVFTLTFPVVPIDPSEETLEHE